WAATCAGDVRVWDVASGKELRRFEVENLNPALTLALTPDGGGLLTFTIDGGLVLWDVATGRQRRGFETGDKEGDEASQTVPGTGFSPDGKLLAAPFFEWGPDDGSLRTGVRLWDVATGKEALRVGDPLKAEDVPNEVPYPAFSPDGKVFARVAPDGTI